MGGVNVQCSLHPQYHDWGALEQGTEPQLLPGCRSINGCPLLRVCVQCVCVHCCVCALWMGLNAEHKSEYGSPCLVVCHGQLSLSLKSNATFKYLKNYVEQDVTFIYVSIICNWCFSRRKCTQTGKRAVHTCKDRRIWTSRVYFCPSCHCTSSPSGRQRSPAKHASVIQATV